jgi:AraC-like DNA-binding protein
MIACPDRMIVRPRMVGGPMSDVLSELLRSVRLRGGVFLDARFTAPWAVSSVVTAEACRPLLEKPAQLIAYHFLLEGRALLTVEGHSPVTVRAGEIVLMPRNDVQVLASGPGLAPVDGCELVDLSRSGGMARIDHGGGGEPTRMFCGFLGSEDACNPLLQALPRVLKIDVHDAASRAIIEASLTFAASELMLARLPSSDAISRLCEFLLIEAVRRYAGTLHGERQGWLRGLNDPQIGRALALIHRDIAAPWSTQSLADDVAMSRSAFMTRFTSLVGTPPIRYRTLWRLEAAKMELRETSHTIARIAHGAGYESEEAFSRAFKRAFGASPTTWRDLHAIG